MGPLLFIILSGSIYNQVIHKPNLGIQWQQIQKGLTSWQLWLVVVMMFINWGIEARKWQLLVKQVQQFSFYKAFKSVLSGCSITMLTPNRVGEYGGRVLYVEEPNRIKAVSLTVVGSISQLLVTLIMGCAGLIFLGYISHTDNKGINLLPQFWETFILSISIGVTAVLLLFYLRLGWLVRLIEKVPSMQPVVKHIRVLDGFTSGQLGHILTLSLVRYMVFVLQYAVLLQVMGVQVTLWLCFVLLTIFYLIMAVAPTIGFTELPVRVTASWTIFKLYTVNELGVGAAALGIWVINLAVPAIIGSLLIISIKIVKDK